LLAFADSSIERARDVGRFSGGTGPDVTPAGRGGGAPQTRPAGQPAPRPPVTTVNASDVEYFRTVSERYRALTGVRSAPATRTPAGAFFEYGYYQFGVPSFSTPGWGLETPATAKPDAPKNEASPPATSQAPSGRGRQGGGGGGGTAAAGGDEPSGTAAFDVRVAHDVAEGFLAWTPFTHPTLGPVEIGGFKPYAVVNPSASRIEALSKSHTAFAMYLMTLFPRIAVADVTADGLGGGLYRIKAEVENTGYLPTSSAHGVTSRSVAPVMVQVGVAPEAVVSGDPKTNFIAALAGSGRRQSYQWIVRGKPGQAVTVKAVAQKGGAAERTVTLK
jgi:hypothetical protein